MPFEFFHSDFNNCPKVSIPALGLELIVRLPLEASGKAITILETSNGPGCGGPMHRHPETEVFRVLEGRYLYEVDGKRFEAATGDLVSVPGGAAHAFINLGTQPARQLVILVPGMDAQAFLLGLGQVLAQGSADRDLLNVYGKPWGVEFLGPPLSKSR